MAGLHPCVDCHKLTEDTRCPEHQHGRRTHARRYQHGPTAYNSARWVRFTRAYKAQHPFCVNAGKDPRCTLVTEVTDHVEPHRGDAVAFWSGPFQPMCFACHSRKTAAEIGLGLSIE
jgi:5-methylcytosine-specific restriction protein A